MKHQNRIQGILDHNHVNVSWNWYFFNTSITLHFLQFQCLLNFTSKNNIGLLNKRPSIDNMF